MNFSNFTEECKYIISNSQNEVIKNKNQQIFPEHLLKSIIENDEINVDILEKAGANIQVLTEKIKKKIDIFPKIIGNNHNIFFSNDLLKVFDNSSITAGKENH